MKLKISKTKASIEERMLSAMVLNTEFLKGYAYIFRTGILKCVWIDYVSEICIKYVKQYNRAPCKDLMDIVRADKKAGRVTDQIFNMLFPLVKALPYDAVPMLNHGYFLDKVKNHMSLCAYETLCEQLQMGIDAMDSKLCDEAYSKAKQVRGITSNVCNPFADQQKVIDAFTRQEKPLFRLNGDIGSMLNPHFKPSRMFAFLARAKAGKTWWLYRIAQAAKRYGNNVAVFSAGDEDEDSSIIRFGCMLTGKNNEEEFCGACAVPVMDCMHNQNGSCTMPSCKNRHRISIPEEERIKLTPEDLLRLEPQYKPCTACRNSSTFSERRKFVPVPWYRTDNVQQLEWPEAWKTFQRFQKWTPNAEMRIFTYPSDTLTVSEIIRQLDMAEDVDNWVPTVVLIDYPDIMANEARFNEMRHLENDKWKKLRKLSQDRKIFLGVVTQSNMGGYNSDSLGSTNVNEDRRKLDHVTGMAAINQTEAEKRAKYQRIGMVVQRKGKFDVERQVMVLNCYEQGRTIIDSAYIFRTKVEDK